jgi:glyoxylase-like metal-dependent hydrolase (beta-lactamase superfamily II)
MAGFISLFLLICGLVLSQQSHLGELNETFDALPASVQSPTIGSSGYSTTPLGYGTYVVTDGSYQIMFAVSTAGVILVDAPPTLGKYITKAIADVTDKPITHVVYSHSHADHIGSASLFTSKNVEIIAHKETLLRLAEVRDTRRPLPTKTFTQDYSLQVGNQTLQLSYKGENHCPGNIFIYMRAPKVLMVVDIVFPGWVPFSELAESTNIGNWIKAHDQILSYDFTHYVGGHVGRPGTRQDVIVQQEYLTDLSANCNASIALTATNDAVLGANNIIGSVAKNNPGNYWADFKVYLDLVAEHCANLTNEKWGSKLGGADAFGFENAYTMTEHLRIDYNVLGPFGG